MEMTYKDILFETQARKKILEGVEVAAKVAGSTLGPRGRLVVIEREGQAPHLTKDGITAIKALYFKDKFMNLGVQMSKEASNRTVEICGDGTTSSSILTHAIVKRGIKLIAAGHNPTDLKRGIDKALPIILNKLQENAKSINTEEEIINIGRISANGDLEIGKMLAYALQQVGKNGVITVEPGVNNNMSLEIVEGMRINRGFCSPFFITNSEKSVAELKNPYILVSNKKFEFTKDLLPLLEQVHLQQRALLIICDDIEAEALAMLTTNKMKGKLEVCAIKAPGFGNSRFDLLEDILSLTGGKIVSNSTGIQIDDIDLTSKDDIIIGSLEKVIVSKNNTTLVSSKNRKEYVEKRISDLQKLMEDPTLSKDELTDIQNRISKLSGGIGIIKVGAYTEVELLEKKDRVDDALCATTVALKDGIVSGGGTALVHAAKTFEPTSQEYKDTFKNESEVAGANILKESCYEPLLKIASNAGAVGEVILHKVIESAKTTGWDALNEKFVDMIENGIIDPVKVPKTALENASSVAGMLLTVECAIIDEL